MIIIQTEDGSIVTDPKEIYIDKDLDGNLHLREVLDTYMARSHD